MARICTYCGLETTSKELNCEHCGKPLEITKSNASTRLFQYYINALKQYANFNGRCSRRDFWMFMLANSIIVFVGLFIGLSLLTVLIESVLSYLLVFVLIFSSFIYSTFMLIPILAMSVRRLHDQDRSGYFLLFNFIPWIGNIAVIILLALPGTPYDNRYGPYQS